MENRQLIINKKFITYIIENFLIKGVIVIKRQSVKIGDTHYMIQKHFGEKHMINDLLKELIVEKIHMLQK